MMRQINKQEKLEFMNIHQRLNIVLMNFLALSDKNLSTKVGTIFPFYVWKA